MTGNGSSTSADAAWIGIGGVSSSDLIQTGTVDSVSASGTASYEAFYELLPDAALIIRGFAINAGDTMDADIHETTTNTWSISLTDDTTHQQYTTTVSYASSLSSAEWIEEDPSSDNGLVPLDTFGSVTFSGSMTTISGTAKNLNAASSAPITLVDRYGRPLATPSAITTNGEGFTVTQN